MKRIFLCHSSSDKNYIEIIARHLGRHKIVFDKMTFEPGIDFRKSIINGLDNTKMFVFFASKKSLESTWCQFEIQEAEIRKLDGRIENNLTIIIDRMISFSELPVWMQKSKIVIQTRPSQARRDIQHLLYSAIDPKFHKPFVGRHNLQIEFNNIMAECDSHKNIFIISGLNGIGKRAYLERTAKDSLDLNLGPYFNVDSTKTLEDIYFWLLNETYDLGLLPEMEKEIQEYRKLNCNDKINEIINRLFILCSDNCLPCFIDNGGMLNDNGKYNSIYELLINNFIQRNDKNYYLAITHERKPLIDSLNQNIFIQRIQPLDSSECILLTKQIFNKNNIKYDTEKLSELIKYINGYPPASYFAAEHSLHYGFDNLIADKSLLVDFKAKRFAKFVNDLTLNPKEWLILQYLAFEEDLPLSVIAAAINCEQDNTASMLRNLIDKSIIVVYDDKYCLSPPIRDSVFRAKGVLNADMYKLIKENLTKTFWAIDSAPTIEIIDATLNALARSGDDDFEKYNSFVRVSNLHSLALQFYHQKKYEKAFDFATRAEKLSPDSNDILIILIKSLIQFEKWEQAEQKLKKLIEKDHKIGFYLKGFMFKKQRKYNEAIKQFESALASGDKSFSVYRDYADCLHRCERHTDAINAINYVLDRNIENIYVLDLVVRIYIDNKDLDSAKKYLDMLERYDFNKKFIYHRKATYYGACKMWESALIEIENSLKTEDFLFESFGQKINILIELKRYDEAQTELNKLSEKYKTQKKDIQYGLYCKLLIRKGNWREAKVVLNKIEEKDKAIIKNYLMQILEMKSMDLELSLIERNQAKNEFQILQKELISAKNNLHELIIDDIDEETTV